MQKTFFFIKSIFSKLAAWFLINFGVLFGSIGFALIWAYVLSVPAWLFLKKQQMFFLWDFASPICGMIFWVFCFAIFRSKPDTLVNIFYEPLMIGLFWLFIFYMRAFFLFRFFENQKLLSFLSIGTFFVLIFFLRAFMPALPE